MNIEYRRDLNHNYMVLESPSEIDTGTYQVRMIISNDINGLLPCSIRGVDGKTLFCFEITSQQSLKTLYEHRGVDALLLLRLYEHIFQVLERLDQFLLNMNDIALVPELIFLDPESDEINFCFLPGYEKNIRLSLRELMEYLLPKIDHKNQDAVMAGYGLYRKITEENCGIESLKSALTLQKSVTSQPSPDIPLEDMDSEDLEPEKLERKKLLDDFFSSSEEEIKPPWSRYIGICITLLLAILLILFKFSSIPLWAVFLILGLLAGCCFAAIFYMWKRKIRDSEDSHKTLPQDTHNQFFQTNMNHSDSSSKDLDNRLPPLYGETELIGNSATEIENARLKPLDTSSLTSIPLNKDLVLVGKLAQAVDGVLDSSTVSRIHAKIKRTEGEYYIGDLNSRNGTFVNGYPVNGEKEVRLNDGDEISFANLTYRFIKK